MMSANAHWLQGERGETLIEFALALMLFLVMTFGTIEFGRAVWQYNVISDLAQEGARWASVHGITAGGPCSGLEMGGCKATADQVQSYVQARASGIPVTVNTYTADPTTRACTTTATDPQSLGAGKGICVKVSRNVAWLVGLIPHPNVTLRSTAQMIMSR